MLVFILVWYICYIVNTTLQSGVYVKKSKMGASFWWLPIAFIDFSLFSLLPATLITAMDDCRFSKLNVQRYLAHETMVKKMKEVQEKQVYDLTKKFYNLSWIYKPHC